MLYVLIQLISALAFYHPIDICYMIDGPFSFEQGAIRTRKKVPEEAGGEGLFMNGEINLFTDGDNYRYCIIGMPVKTSTNRNVDRKKCWT